MSSTNRGSVREASDYYATPQNAVRAALDKLFELENTESVLSALDPCAGGNVENETHYFTDMPYPKVLEDDYGISVDTIDIREDSLADIKGDFLEMSPDTYRERYDLVITNPPFSIAEDVIRHSFEFVNNGKFVMMLLRLNFLEGLKRKDLFDSYMPKYIFVHRKRIDFTRNIKTGKHGTDSIAYAHFVWQKGKDFGKSGSKLFILC